MRPFKGFVQARKELQEILSAFEFMDNTSQKLTAKHLGLEHPIESGDFPFYVLIETSGSNKEHDDENWKHSWGMQWKKV